MRGTALGTIQSSLSEQVWACRSTITLGTGPTQTPLIL